MNECNEFIESDSSAPAGSSFDGSGAVSREDLAEYLLKHRHRIRRRVLEKARRVGLNWFDPDDVTDSVIRRIDAAHVRRALRTDSGREVWAFIIAVADNLVFTRLRSPHPVALPAGPGSSGDERLAERFAACRDDDETAALLHEMLLTLESDDDRELLLLRSRGAPYWAIAQAAGRSETVLRARWVKIRRVLCEQSRTTSGRAHTAEADLTPPPS